MYKRQLQYGLSGQRMGYFYMNGKQYEILGEINRQQRNKPADLKASYVRSSNGDMIQLDNLIELESGIAPPKDVYKRQLPLYAAGMSVDTVLFYRYFFAVIVLGILMKICLLYTSRCV